MSVWKRYTLILVIMVALAIPGIAANEKIKVMVSIADMAGIAKEIGGDYVDVKYILPPATDPHSFSLTREKIEEIKGADLIVLANSNLLSYEKKIKELYAKQYLDFPDYEKNGAVLLSFNGYENNPHGYWLYYKNAIAIAKTIADKLSNMTGNYEYFHKNFERFKEKIEAARNCINESNLNGKEVVASVPGVCYIAANYGIKVKYILMMESEASTSIQKMNKIKNELKNESCIGIVVPSFMKYAKAGEMALNLARDTGSRVIYVNFISESSYEKTFYDNFIQFLTPSKIEEKKYNGELILLCIALTIFAIFEGGIIYALWRR